MFFILKFSLTFICSFLILSIPISNQTLFEHIHDSTYPYTKNVVSVVKKNLRKTTDEISEVGKNAFHNTRPKETPFDKVRDIKSSIVKEELIESHNDYTDEEKASLLRVLEKAQR